MISTLRALREEIAATINSAVPAHSKYPASPIPPFAVVGFPDNIEFNYTLAGRSELDLPVTVYVGIGDVDSGQDALDALITGSLRTALEQHSATTWKAVQVVSVNNFRPEEASGSAKMLAADFNLTLIA